MDIRHMVILLICFIEINSLDYCNSKLCQPGTEHIGCNNTGVFHSICRYPQIHPIDSTRRAIILNTHNTLRNKFANGDYNFATAARMYEIQWHSELAYLAGLNTKQCKLKHDQCRDTNEFKYCGQNLGTISSMNEIDIEKYIELIITSWFNEYKDTSQSYLNKLPKNTNSVIGHFTNIINDKVKYIGCAATSYSSYIGNLKYRTLLLACNYNAGNIIGRPVYTPGLVSSECINGCSSKYPGLCIDPIT